MVILELVVVPGYDCGKSPTFHVFGLDVGVVETHEEWLFAFLGRHFEGMRV